MIITCEQCATQFQLDDAKVPASGVRVRCSRCKHAFFVESPEAAGQDLGAADRDARDALDAEAPAPDPDFQDSNEVTHESDWEFNEAPIGAKPSGENAPAETHDAAREAIDDLLGSRSAAQAAATDFGAEDEDLGSPDSWDLLAGDSASASAPAASAPREASGPDPAAPAPSITQGPAVEEWVPPSRPSAVLAWISRMGHAIGWSATAILLGVVAYMTLAPSSGSESELGSRTLAGLEAREISGRWVENAVAGSIFVVSGRLANSSSTPAALETQLGIRLLDESGARLPGEAAAAGPVLLERELREAAPSGIQARQVEAGLALASERIQPGQSLDFEAVVGSVPLAASRFVLEPYAPGRNSSRAAAGDPAIVR